jgi:uncharacterized protein
MERDDAVRAACQRGDLEALQQLFPDGPTEWSYDGCSLLHMAVRMPHAPVLDWLLTFPFDVNAPTPVIKTTPLMWACVYRNEAMARRLLAQGADLQATDLYGRTALHWTCMYGWAGGVTWLLEQGADPEARDEKGRLPEDTVSVSSPHYATLCALLEAARQGCGLK